MSDHVTGQPARDTRVTTALPPASAAPPQKWWRKLGARGGAGVGILVVAWVALTALGWLPIASEPEDPIQPELVRPVELAELFDLAREQDEPARPWPAADGQDPRLEAVVQQLLDNVRYATGKQGLDLPVRFADASFQSGTQVKGSHVSGAVLIGRELVEVSHLSDSVVICPGAVRVSFSQGNCIIAGQYLDIGFDGSAAFGTVFGVPSRSLLVSGRRVQISHAKDSITLSPEVNVSHANRVLFLHRRSGEVSHRAWCREVRTPGVLTPMPPVEDPLAGVIEFIQTGVGEKSALLLREKGSSHGFPVETGRTFTKGLLAGWRVVMTTGRVAVLHDGKRWSLLTLSDVRATSQLREAK